MLCHVRGGEKAFKRPQKRYERCPSHTFNSVYEVDRKEGQQQEAQPRRQEARTKETGGRSHIHGNLTCEKAQ